MTYFTHYLNSIPSRSSYRLSITNHTYHHEQSLIQQLLPLAKLNEEEEHKAHSMARSLAYALREHHKPGLVEQLIQEFNLASDEGIALMSLAEAVLRTPDTPTRNDLIRDHIAFADWLSHAGKNQGLIINASSWGLMLTQKIIAPSDRVHAVNSLLQRYGAPFITRAVQSVIMMMGKEFILGETIDNALKNAQERRQKGFTYSYDMLGEAALTQNDAERYLAAYYMALEAIGQHAKREHKASIYERNGISIKLSALHPRYHYSQRERVLKELYPIIKNLALRARHYDIGLTIDAEESARLELSLDLLEMLCQDHDLQNWHGIGFVVQAYSKRASFVIDYLADLAKNTQHRLMVRLVKGAYWDSEIKHAQSESYEDFPVFTRKSHTDVSYLACARKLFEASSNLFPQFATHNAHTVATIYQMAEKYFPQGFQIGDYEFQGLHGMGEPLYDNILGIDYYNRPCRLYGPVGTYEHLLAYLVRRLLENGANSSFMHLLGDKEISLDRLVENPITQTCSFHPIGSPHPLIAKPSALFGKTRLNSKGLDLNHETTLQTLQKELNATPTFFKAFPLTPHNHEAGSKHPIYNPAHLQDHVGEVHYSTEETIKNALEISEKHLGQWASYLPGDRAKILQKAADLLEEKRPLFMALALREAGKNYANAVSEIREAVDFLRYYAEEINSNFNNETHLPLGSIICISPWNFPLAIFIGQIATALAAGNHVLAKPSEETPLIAFEAVKILHEAGVPDYALHYLPGNGAVGAALIAQKNIAGVMFTGSNEVAKTIAKQLARRIGRNQQPIPFIAETGGQNAMIVDSTALPEQAVQDILASAFDSAGQRCSALRLLCIQDDAYPSIMPLLKGAMAELKIGHPASLDTDIGPIISKQAQESINHYIQKCKNKKYKIFSSPLSKKDTENGHFIAPTLVEIHSLDDLEHEVFGPILHILRYPRRGLNELIKNINKTGYGLTFGIHSRLPSRKDYVCDHAHAGNIYINRNMIGAVVGMQPFGGYGLSGTGPKAGGPLAIRRQLAQAPLSPLAKQGAKLPNMARSWLLWLGVDDQDTVQDVTPWMEHGLLHFTTEMPSPVGEQNLYRLIPHGTILGIAETEKGLKRIISYALSCGNSISILCSDELWESLRTMSDILKETIKRVSHKETIYSASLILAENDHDILWKIIDEPLSLENYTLPLIYFVNPQTLRPEMLLKEQLISTNMTATGGNAHLMSFI